MEIAMKIVPTVIFAAGFAAALLSASGAAFDETEVRAELAKRLARFKVPSYFIVYEQFPMLGSGKIDGEALKEDVMQRLS